jgi:hypothetical protein
MIGPSGDWPEDLDERFEIEVVTASGTTEPVDFLVHLNAVEVWFQDRCRAVLSRRELHCWLAEPRSPLVVDDIALSLDHLTHAHGGEAPVQPGPGPDSRPGVMVWTLTPDALSRLRRQV